MNLILKFLGIKKDTKYFVSYMIIKDGEITCYGHITAKQRGEFDIDAIMEKILIDPQEYRDFSIKNIIITSITKI